MEPNTMDPMDFNVVDLDNDGTEWPGDAGGDNSEADSVRGMGGDDTLRGGPGNDHLNGNKGDDLVRGGDGDDHLRGGMGDDAVHGEDGDDTAYGDKGDDTVHGDAGNDALHGNEGNDHLHGGEGADILHGGMNNDVLYGNVGNDTLYGDGTEGNGSDFLYGGAGDDMIMGFSGNDQAFGGDGNDTINGNMGNDTLWGGDGADSIHGGKNDDLIYGGYEKYPSGDISLGDVGGSSLVDTLKGDYGDDTIFAGMLTDANVHQDEAGQTTVSFNPPGETTTSVTFKRGNMLEGGSGDDELYGAQGTDELDGGSGDDLLVDGAGVDKLMGGTGDDSLYGAHNYAHDATPAALTVDGTDSTAQDEGGNTLMGGDGDDMLMSAVRANDSAAAGSMSGKADTLDGGNGEDHLIASHVIDANGANADFAATSLHVGLVMVGGNTRGEEDTFDVSMVDGASIGNSVIEIRDFQVGVDKIHSTLVQDTTTDNILVVEAADFDAAGELLETKDYTLVRIDTNVVLKMVGVSAEAIDDHAGEIFVAVT